MMLTPPFSIKKIPDGGTEKRHFGIHGNSKTDIMRYITPSIGISYLFNI